MKPLLAITTITLIAITIPALATSGKLGTLPLGQYVCSIPGDAGGDAWVVLDGKGFTIGNASTYHTPEGSGTYLLAGKNVTFTRGPMKGMRFKRSGSSALQWVDQKGEPGRVRCVREAGSL